MCYLGIRLLTLSSVFSYDYCSLWIVCVCVTWAYDFSPCHQFLLTMTVIRGGCVCYLGIRLLTLSSVFAYDDCNPGRVCVLPGHKTSHPVISFCLR